jgi:probable HAF family extracellular repeat protein
MESQCIGRGLRMAGLLCLATAMAAAQQYNMVQLGLTVGSVPGGLNNNGEVVGFDNLTRTPFLYSGGVVTPFGPSQMTGIAINDGEQIALNAPTGHAYISGSFTIPQPFPLPPYVIPYFVDLGTLYSAGYAQGMAMNNSGTIVGESWSPTVAKRAFSWSFSTGVMTDLGTMGANSSARGINSAGQIVGQGYTSAGYQRAFQMVGGTMTDMDPPNPAYDSYATAINDAGQIVVVTNKAWHLVQINRNKLLWTAYRGPNWYTLLYNGNGTNVDVGNLGSTLGTFGQAMNNAGDVVGTAYIPAGNPHAFVRHGGVMLDLNSHVLNLPAGWIVEMATNINDYGQIVCSVIRPGEFNTLVVLTPVPD